MGEVVGREVGRPLDVVGTEGAESGGLGAAVEEELAVAVESGASGEEELTAVGEVGVELLLESCVDGDVVGEDE